MPTEEERVRPMMEMFRPELAMTVDSGSEPPTTVADCVTYSKLSTECCGSRRSELNFTRLEWGKGVETGRGIGGPMEEGTTIIVGQRIKETTSLRKRNRRPQGGLRSRIITRRGADQMEIRLMIIGGLSRRLGMEIPL